MRQKRNTTVYTLARKKQQGKIDRKNLKVYFCVHITHKYPKKFVFLFRKIIELFTRKVYFFLKK